MTDILALAEQLDDAARLGRAVPQLSARHNLTLDDAQAIQHGVVARRLARGERPAGLKLGPASPAGLRALGLDAPIGGRLTSAMAVPDGGEIDPAGFIDLRVEVEIAFLLRRDLPPGDIAAGARDAVEAVAPALELADSRYPGYRFTLADLVADNCCAAGYVLGAWQDPAALAGRGLSLDNLGMTLCLDGRLVQTASTGAIMGDPWRMAAHGLRHAAATGQDLSGGQILLSGAPAPPLPVAGAVHVSAEVQGLGCVAVSLRGPRSV
ncbi:MAG: fumarylacetoacetate hydrolase family protein [Sneathiellaceae bacterium]